MARKFTTGRQNDIALNPELYNILMSLRYINNGAVKPTQNKQSPIPAGAIWNDSSKGRNILKINKSNGEWTPAFEGYYHPAGLKEKPLYPVDGQLWVDPNEDNTLKMYDQNADVWIAVKSVQTNAHNLLVDAHNNFINMTQLKDMDEKEGQKTFLIPYENFGKLFDKGLFIHQSDANYEALSEVSVQYTTESEEQTESWIHVNANKLFSIEKKLLKIVKEGVDAYRVYGLFDNNTEFYYIDETNFGIAMQPYKAGAEGHDFIPFEKGIEIVSDKVKSAEYILAISYTFYDTPTPGKVIKRDFTIGKQSEVYVGKLTKRPMIFLDGLYLEQDKYNYSNINGRIEIDDTIINPMDMMAIVFEDLEETGEKQINNITGPGTDTMVGTFTNALKFKKPLAFVSGVMGTNIFTSDEIIIKGKSIIIKNFGPGVASPCKVMVVEANNMYLDHGYLNEKAIIVNEKISNNPNDEYILFVDGVLMSSRELDISEGEIRIANGIEGQQFVLLKIQDDETTALSFDNKIMNYTTPITNEDGTLYNECNNAIVFADGKLALTEDTVMRDSLPLRGMSGQIVKVKSKDSRAVYEYYLWNDETALWDLISDEEEINKINTYFKANYSNGSIMLDATDMEDKIGTYYAYTYANGVEEPLLKGKRKLTPDRTEYSVNVEHNYSSSEGALSVYVNKLLSPFVYDDGTNLGKFIIPELIADEGIDPYEDAEAVYYVERAEKKELIACERQVLTAKDRDTDYIGGYRTSVSLVPGVVNVYVNGVRLDKQDYSVISANTLIIHKQIVGNQNNYKLSDSTTWNKFQVYGKDKVYEIECEREDYILIEVRQDYSLKTQSIPVRYEGQVTFYADDDGIPKSLILSQDLIKIYIDGVIYTGEYSINRNNYSITLLDQDLQNMLNTDPIARYFDLNPDEHEKYILENGAAYVANPTINEITFEWR